MTARPIITMDEADELLWLVDPDQPAKPVYLGFVRGNEVHGLPRCVTFEVVRALADFLDQLAGANLLSEVGTARHRVTKGCDCSQCYGASDDACQDCGYSFESPGVPGICAMAHRLSEVGE